jgi:hypothetical protein
MMLIRLNALSDTGERVTEVIGNARDALATAVRWDQQGFKDITIIDGGERYTPEHYAKDRPQLVQLPLEPRNPPALRPEFDGLVHVQVRLCPLLGFIVIPAAEFVSGSRDARRVDCEKTVVLGINTHELKTVERDERFLSKQGSPSSMQGTGAFGLLGVLTEGGGPGKT